MRPVASTVSSRATAAPGMRYQTVRANEPGPRHGVTPASPVASASSATACRSTGSPASAAYGSNTPAAAGASFGGAAAYAAGARSPVRASRTMRTAERGTPTQTRQGPPSCGEATVRRVNERRDRPGQGA